MSKVIHLSDDAHNKAKDFCKDRGLRMSDWVATLIETAIANGTGATSVAAAPAVTAALPNGNGRPGVAPVNKRRDVRRHDEGKSREELEAVYAAPPFWAGRAHSGS